MKGMLKSQFILIKRNKCLSLIELFCPAFILAFYFLLRLSFTQKIEKYKEIFEDDAKYLFQFSTNLTNKITSKEQIITSFEDLDVNSPINYTGFLYKCKINKHIAIIGNDFPEEILGKIRAHFWELDNIDENDFFKKFETIEEFDKYITSKEYGSENYPKICFGISKDDKYKYKFGIHFETINVDNDEGNEIENYLLTESPHIPESKSNKNEKIKKQENLKYFDYYKSSGYLMIMKLISDYILQEITNNSNAEIDYSIIGMIFDQIIKDPFHKYLYLLGFFIIISYSIIFSINIYREIHFRETKKKEYLKSMGMKEKVFFLSSFFRSFIFNIIHSLLGALIINRILNQTQYIYLALILFLFGLVIFSMTYFFQSFLQESRKGVIFSLLSFCIMSFLYLPINSPEINKSIIYLFCILFPPTNLLLGLNVFYIFEKEFVFFNNNIKIDVSQITIMQMILFFICSFFIYLFIGYIISQFFCYEYGVKKHCFRGKKKSINTDKIEINIKEDENKNNEISNLGDNYIDDDSGIGQHKPDVDHLKKSIKVMAYDLMNTPSATLAYEKKLDFLKKSIKELDVKESFLPENKIIEDKNFIKDEIEVDFKIRKEMQEIRNKRRSIKNSMSNVKSNENFINNNLKISEIKNFLPNNDSFLSKSLKDALSENSFIDNTKLEENEYNKIKDEINPGARLVIDNIKKSYKKENYVLDGLSCTFYENEIYGLLGENGAGKSTLISILSGLIEATSGSIRYQINPEDIGSDITTSEGISIFRKTLGICPQNNNILFENLTVKENLEIFCLFKYVKYDKRNDIENDKKNSKEEEKFKNIEDEVNYLLKTFQLDKQKDTLIETLSGGQKRKLCIAIACCGRSKVIILDEPTGGIDIPSRKNIWNILKQLKTKGKIIILITHFMDEASFLADKIGILSHGKIIVSGTNRYLIDKYGQYITFKINKKMEIKNVKEIAQLIEDKYCDNNKKDIQKGKYLINEDGKSSNSSEEEKKTNTETQNTSIISIKSDNKIQIETFKERAVIRIPKKKFIFKKSQELLEKLEKEYKIKSYSIELEKLEDVFINSINTKILDNQMKKGNILLSDLYIIKYNGFGNFINELKLSFFKRIRSYKSIISEILFPVLLTLIACLVSYVEWLEDNKSNYIELNNYNNEKQTIYIAFSDLIEIEKYSSQLLSVDPKEKEKLKNYSFKLLPNYLSKDNYTLSENLVAYMITVNEYAKNQGIINNTASFYLISANDSSHKYEFASIISSKKRHFPITFTNYLLKNIINYEIKQNKKKEFLDDVGITNYPFHLTYEEKNNKKARNGFVLIFFVSIGLSLIPSNFIIPIIREKQNKSKHLQILSGLSLFTYWLNNYIFEICKFFIITLISLLTLYFFNFYEKYLISLYVLYCPALISFTYCISCFIDSEGVGQTVVLLINLLFGAIGGSAILILRTNKDLKNIAIFISYIFRLVPSFCISYGYNELLSKKLLFAIDNFNLDIQDIEVFKKQYNSLEYIIDYIKVDFIYLFLEIIVYTTFLILLEKKDYIKWKFNCKNKSFKNSLEEDFEEEDLEEEDFEEEDNGDPLDILNNNKNPTSKVEIEQKKKQKKPQNIYPLKVNKLKKYFGNKFNIFNFCKRKKVLDGLSFRVRDGECFGFIGANGAGKTTAFRCFCKEITPNYGLITINKNDIFDYASKNNYSIGYCPQFDTVFENLTVEQNLEFYGQLKGIKENYLKEICLAIMKQLDLYKFRYLICKNLSGGNKRKVSVGISIICQPDIILMDEPSTGMDPFTRKLLLNLLHNSYLKNKNKEKQKAIVLTTHSIEEVEALCDKIGILINGNIAKDGKGTINKVIQKHSKGVELNVEFKIPSLSFLKNKYGKDLLNGEISDLNGIKTFLRNIKKNEYFEYIDKESLGRDILEGLGLNDLKNEKDKKDINNKGDSKEKNIKKEVILNWVTQIDYLLALVDKLKKYFSEIKCIDFKLNNFILIVKGIKVCDSFIFGLIEGNKEALSIEEYSYSLTSLEEIFLKLCQSSYEYDKKGNDLLIEEKSNNKINIIL